MMVVTGAEERAVDLVVGQRGAVIGNLAVTHHDRSIDQRGKGAELVGHQDDGDTATLQGGEGVGERLLVGQVDAGGGLVEQQQIGLAGQGASNEGSLLLPPESTLTPSRRRSRRPTTSRASLIAARSRGAGAARAGDGPGARC